MAAAPALFLCLFLGLLLHSRAQPNDTQIAYEGQPTVTQVAYEGQATDARVAAAVQGLPTGTNNAYGAVYQIIRGNSGVAAMHMIVNCQGNVLIVDRWNANARDDAEEGDGGAHLPVCGDDQLVDGDCQVVHKRVNGRNAHAVLWNLKSNKITDYVDTMTNTFCSSGGIASDGRAYVLGGTGDGVDTVRAYGNGGPEMEVLGTLNSKRWYSTWENMADGRGVLVGGQKGLPADGDGSNNPTLEYYPKARDAGEYAVKILEETGPENLYPFVYTLPDGKLFILGRWMAAKWDPLANTEERLADIPGAGRSYHASAASVLLPLRASAGFKAEVLVCGGGSQVRQRRDTPATDSCGRICVFGCGGEAANQWDMSDKMPSARHMGTAVLLPTLNVVIVGGMGTGRSGFQTNGLSEASAPQYKPALYQTYGRKGARFSSDVASRIARTYHSSAVLLPDATVAIAGSNENRVRWWFQNVPYPSEFRIERYSPPYLRRNQVRPVLNALPNAGRMFAGKKYTITGTARAAIPSAMRVVIVSSGWSTHGYNHAQRLVVPAADFTFTGNKFSAVVTIPANKNVLPPSCYFMYVVYKASPSVGLPVRIG